MDNDLAVYIHWPYCARICPYCDFNVYKNKEDGGLTEAITSDATEWRKWSGERIVRSIHFGGGTPSLMSAADIASLIQNIGRLWNLRPDAEIAIEANPQDASRDKWEGYHDAGINRLSLGVQTFDDAALKFLGRDHNADKALNALNLAIDIFPSVSLDLIFGWAGQTQAQWQRDIDIALGSGAQHISAYQLTIEDGTAFGKSEARGETRAVDEDGSAQFYDMARVHFTAAGYEHYEVSNFAKPGHRSKHNLAYWQGRDYVGVGPGAHGRLTVDGKRYATIAEMRPEAYRESVGVNGFGYSEKEALTPAAWAEEYLLMGLRITEGISLSRYAEIAGAPLDAARIQNLSKDGLLQKHGDRIAATDKGRLLLNWVTEKLLLG